MSLKPIDNSVSLPRSQEMSKLKQAEISKGKSIVDNNFNQRDKNAIKIQKKVIETKKTQYNKIGKEESKEKSRHSRENRDNKESSDNTDEDDNVLYVGKNVDIRV